MGASLKTIAKETLPDPRKLGCAHEGARREVDKRQSGVGPGGEQMK